jgi:hypothetical protein
MHVRHVEIFLVGTFMLAMLGGCASSTATNGTAAAAPVTAGPQVPDVRTEAALIRMENQYIADKNSQPTHQHEAEAEKRKKEEEEMKRQQAEAQQKAEPEAREETPR